MSEFSGIWIPKEILGLSNLPFLHKGVLAQITELSKGNSGCWATDTYFSTLFQVERSNINRIIKNLSNLGYIRVRTEKNHGNKRLITPCVEMIQPLYQNDTTPCVEMIQPLYQNDTTPCVEMIQPLYQNDTTIYNDERKDERKEENKDEILDTSSKDKILNFSSLGTGETLKEKKENPPPNSGSPPPSGSLKAKVADAAKYVEHIFAEDELADPVKFAALIAEKNPKLDDNYYYLAVAGWRDQYGKPPKRKVWASVINQFILNDHKQGKLQFKKDNANANENPDPPVRNPNLKPLGIQPKKGREFGSW